MALKNKGLAFEHAVMYAATSRINEPRTREQEKAFKEAAAKWCNERFKIDIDPNTEVTSLIGGKEGIHNLIMAYVDRGDYVLVGQLLVALDFSQGGDYCSEITGVKDALRDE